MNEQNSGVSKGWNITLWIAQVVLALAFGMAGVMKSTQPIAQLATAMDWPGDVPAGLVRLIGVSEFAAALGMILPAATRIRPMLTPLAGGGLVLIMVLASAFHLTRGELPAILFNFCLALVAGYVAWGRTKKSPILPRTPS